MDEVALYDVLNKDRPSNRAEHQLHRVYDRVMGAAYRLGHASKFPYRICGDNLNGGLAVLESLVAELRICAAQVIHIREAVANERREFVQDWLQWAAIIENGQHEDSKP